MKISLQTGQEFIWKSFWAEKEMTWEVVFSTWMTGYEQTLTDPSFAGQIITFTQPMIWNYWIPSDEVDEFWLMKNFESKKIYAAWVVVSEYSENYSHWKAVQSLWEWLKKQWIPAISWIDTRELTKILREQGSTLWWIISEKSSLSKEIKDPNLRNLVGECSIDEVKIYEPKNNIWKTVLVYDYWIKNNILREFLKRWVKVIHAPFDAKITDFEFDWLFLSNGPWNPEIAFPFAKENILYAIEKNIPTFWICLWNQLLSLAIWAETEKMDYWHRWANQPCTNLETWKCYITSQNHGYHVKSETLPDWYEKWWENANDWTFEWLKHKTKNIKTVQFHPESCPWPEDTNFLFDDFIKSL